MELKKIFFATVQDRKEGRGTKKKRRREKQKKQENGSPKSNLSKYYTKY